MSCESVGCFESSVLRSRRAFYNIILPSVVSALTAVTKQFHTSLPGPFKHVNHIVVRGGVKSGKRLRNSAP